MDVPLSPELTSFVEDNVRRGRYMSVSDMLGEALELLRERDAAALEQLQRDIQVGIDDIERGDCEEYDETNLHTLFEQVEKEGREILARRRSSR